MESGKRKQTRFIRTISTVLAVTLTLLWAVPSGTGSAYQRFKAPCNLATQGNYIDGIAHEEDVVRRDKAMLVVTMQNLLKKYPDLLLSVGNPAANSYTKLHRGKGVSSFFSRTYAFPASEELLEKGIKDIYLVPSLVGASSYFAALFVREDGKYKYEAYTIDEMKESLEGLAEQGVINGDLEVLNHYRGLVTSAVMQDDVRFIDFSDDAIQAVSVFLDSIGANSSKGMLKGIVERRKVLLVGEELRGEIEKGKSVKRELAFPSDDRIITTEEEDAQKRAESILQNIFTLLGVKYSSAAEAFSAFWKLWEEDEEGTFDIDEVDYKLKISVKEAEEKMEDTEASNEGGMRFANRAYENMPNLGSYELHDCQETIDDLNDAFRIVAEKALPEKAKPHYEKYLLRLELEKKREAYEERLQQFVDAQNFESAAKMRDRIEEVNRNIRKKANVSKDYIEFFRSIPGIGPGNIRTKLFAVSKEKDALKGDVFEDEIKTILGENPSEAVEEAVGCLLPTARERVENGAVIVEVNENFIKMMHHYAVKGMKGKDGDILDYPRGSSTPEPVIGNYYYSLLFAVATHVIHGHLKIAETDGDAAPKPAELLLDEAFAQGERGNKYAYVNTLALWFHLVTVVEKNVRPEERMENHFMIRYKEAFRKLSEAEKKNLPRHMTDLVLQLRSRDAVPHKTFDYRPTGMTAEDVDKVLKEFPDSTSNEGASNEGGMRFAGKAYTQMPDMRSYELHDCGETIKDIRGVLRAVAEYRLPEHLKLAYKKYRNRMKLEKELASLKKELDKTVKDEKFEEAAKVKERIGKIKREIKDGRASVSEKDIKIFNSIPGLNPDNTRIKLFSVNNTSSLLPTDRVRVENGVAITEFNENFVKFMHHLASIGMKSPKGDVLEYPRDDIEHPRVLGNFWYSIIYSIATHTIDGHFEIHENGVARFIADESHAQRRRGNSHAYINKLVIWFYLITLVEQNSIPQDRLKNHFMKVYEEYFKEGLSKEEFEKFGEHITDMVLQFKDQGVSPYGTLRYIDTGMTPKDVDSILNEYPDTASNEGAPETHDKWAHAIADIFLEGEKAKEAIASGEKKMLILGTDWIKDKQLTLIQPLIQRIKQLGEQGAVNVVWQRQGEDSKSFALRAMRAKVDLGVRAKDMVIMGSVEGVNQQAFEGLRARDEFDKDSAFFVGMDGKRLDDDSFVRLLEAITFAMRMASGQKTLNHPKIMVGEAGPRMALFILIPDAEKIDPREAIENPYKNQLKIIRAA